MVTKFKESDVLLKVRDLKIQGYTDETWVDIIKGVDLTLHRGEVMGLIGESGAGKSTIGAAAMGYARDGTRISDGSIEFDGYYGKYSYHLTAEDGKSCTGSIDLLQDPEEVKRKDQWGWRGAEGEAQVFVVKCNWEGHVHIPVWTTPAALALCAVSCLYACWRQKASLKNKGNRRGGQHQQIRPAGE